MKRVSFTLDESLVTLAYELGINISVAAREGVEAAVRAALTQRDRASYKREPEVPEPFWSAEAWDES
jgi:post-segregation antitoxin (ccd killing protein)